jgi:hypothetical protein
MHETPQKMRIFDHNASATRRGIRHADDDHDHHRQQEWTRGSPPVSRRAAGASMMPAATMIGE